MCVCLLTPAWLSFYLRVPRVEFPVFRVRSERIARHFAFQVNPATPDASWIYGTQRLEQHPRVDHDRAFSRREHLDRIQIELRELGYDVNQRRNLEDDRNHCFTVACHTDHRLDSAADLPLQEHALEVCARRLHPDTQ